MLRLVPSLRAYAQPLTDAMVDFYTMSQVSMKVLAVTDSDWRSSGDLFHTKILASVVLRMLILNRWVHNFLAL